MANKKQINKNEEALSKVLGSRGSRKRYKSADFKKHYINSTSLSFSVWDAVITFGLVVHDESGELDGIEEQFDVTMSHSHFKAFTKVLSYNLAAIEEKYGEIQILDLQSNNNK